MKSQGEEISKERWEEEMIEVLQPSTGSLSPQQWLRLNEDLAAKRIEAMRAISPASSPSPASTLASDLWACLLLLPRLLRWAIAEAAQISRELGDRHVD